MLELVPEPVTQTETQLVHVPEPASLVAVKKDCDIFEKFMQALHDAKACKCTK